MVNVLVEFWHVVVRINDVNGETGVGSVNGIGNSDLSHMHLFHLVVQRFGKRNTAAVLLNSEHASRVARFREGVDEAGARVDVVGDHCSDKTSYGQSLADINNGAGGNGLVVVDIDDVDLEQASAGHLRRAFVSSDDGESVLVLDFSVENDVRLDNSREWRFDNERVVVVPVDNVVYQVGIGGLRRYPWQSSGSGNKKAT